jgi:hypothetical protein
MPTLIRLVVMTKCFQVQQAQRAVTFASVSDNARRTGKSGWTRPENLVRKIGASSLPPQVDVVAPWALAKNPWQGLKLDCPVKEVVICRSGQELQTKRSHRFWSGVDKVLLMELVEQVKDGAPTAPVWPLLEAAASQSLHASIGGANVFTRPPRVHPAFVCTIFLRLHLRTHHIGQAPAPASASPHLPSSRTSRGRRTSRLVLCGCNHVSDSPSVSS